MFPIGNMPAADWRSQVIVAHRLMAGRVAVFILGPRAAFDSSYGIPIFRPSCSAAVYVAFPRCNRTVVLEQ